MSPRPPSFVAIGASGAEGLDDIKSLLNLLRKPVQAIVMVVLHRPTDRVSYLQEVLARSCEMSVVVADDATVMESGVCYIGQPTGHLTLMGIRLAHLVPARGNRFRERPSIYSLSHWPSMQGAGRRASSCLAHWQMAHGVLPQSMLWAASQWCWTRPKTRGLQQNAIDYDGPISFIGTASGIALFVNQNSR